MTQAFIRPVDDMGMDGTADVSLNDFMAVYALRLTNDKVDVFSFSI
jgi:hypothetical protein